MKNKTILTVFLVVLSSSFVNAKEAKVRGSIALSKGSGQNYSELAKITIQEAIARAQKASRGHVTSTKLENEDGYLVYSIAMDEGNSTTEVLVDAGTGKVLAVEKDEHNSSSEKNGHDEEDDDQNGER